MRKFWDILRFVFRVLRKFWGWYWGYWVGFESDFEVGIECIEILGLILVGKGINFFIEIKLLKLINFLNDDLLYVNYIY